MNNIEKQFLKNILVFGLVKGLIYAFIRQSAKRAFKGE